MNPIKGEPSSRYRLGVVVSRFNNEVTGKLLEGAMEAAARSGIERGSVVVVSVPGAFEIPGAALKLASSGKVDAIACLGAVVRGETPHFDYVCSAAQQGILQVGLRSGIPVTFGVLTTDDVAQATERAGGIWGNKGFEAAMDALEMADLYGKIGQL